MDKTLITVIVVYLAGVVGHMAFFAWLTWRNTRQACGTPVLCLGALLFPDTLERWSRKVTVAAMQDLLCGVVFSVLWPLGWLMVGAVELVDFVSRLKGDGGAT